MRLATPSGPLTRSPLGRARLVTAVALAGMLVACGSPDATTDPASTPPAPGTPTTSDTPQPTTPDTETTTPADETPRPTPTRGDVTPTDGTPALPPDVLPTPLPRPTGSIDPQVQAVVDEAVADLASRLDVDPATIGVLAARAETFRDGAVGCPQPGQFYTQALVDGYRVVLVRGDRAWLYTAAEGQAPELCASDADDGGHGWVPPPGFDE